MAYALMIGGATFDIEQVVAVVPTRNAETGEPRLDVHLVQQDGSDAHVIVFGDRAVRTVHDLRRRRLTGRQAA